MIFSYLAQMIAPDSLTEWPREPDYYEHSSSALIRTIINYGLYALFFIFLLCLIIGLVYLILGKLKGSDDLEEIKLLSLIKK